ncbi:MAG TPA: hypothetical protein VNP92_09110 [Actinophytocola sp.]|nr:hypothetical protein [Actinophytocola sp.]
MRQLTDEIADCGSAITVYEHRVVVDLFAGTDANAERLEQAAAHRLAGQRARSFCGGFRRIRQPLSAAQAGRAIEPGQQQSSH